MSGRRYSPPPPPRDSGGSGSTINSYRKADERRLPRYDEPSSSRRRSPSPHARSGRRDERDWRRGDTDRSRDGQELYRDSRRSGAREDRYIDRPPRARPGREDRSLEGHDRRGQLDRRDRENGSNELISVRRRSRSPQTLKHSTASRPTDDGSRSNIAHEFAHSPRYDENTHDIEEGEAPESGSITAEMKPEQGDIYGDIEEGEDEEEDAMEALMGFGGFGTTKGRKVAGNEAGAAEIKKERTWRQYMNRKGGFNRPLDKIK